MEIVFDQRNDWRYSKNCQSQPNAGEPKGYGGDQFLLEWHGLRAGQRALLGSDLVVHIADIESACESVALVGLWNRVSIKLELYCSKWPATAEIIPSAVAAGGRT